MLEVANAPEHASRPPAQIVAALADKGEWLASESTIYRVLRDKRQQHHRGRAKNPVHRPPASHSATAPNQVWTWDITWLKSPVRGKYYHLYMIVDIFSRYIVGWEVHEEETGECARELITKAYLKQALWRSDSPLVLHSDNGTPMKASTFRATLERLGISNSYSRPRTSDDNAYSESLFRTCSGPLFLPGNCPRFVAAKSAWDWRSGRGTPPRTLSLYFKLAGHDDAHHMVVHQPGL